MKVVQGFSIDEDLDKFLGDKYYELRERSKSALLNKILIYIKDNPNVLEEIING